MKKLSTIIVIILFGLILYNNSAAQGKPKSPDSSTPSTKPTEQQFEEWADQFTGDKLDETKWEKFTFAGGSGGRLEVKDGEVRIRSGNNTRAGIRSVKTFTGDRFIAEAHLAKVGAAYPEPGNNDAAVGFANLTILFDGSGRNRVEWILNSNGNFEAWAVTDGRGERLDKLNLATKMKNPVLSIVRRGDEFLFVLNSAEGKPQDAQVGLSTTVKNMPKSFRVMLYGYGSSENNWDWARVVVAK
ncbi:MAG: hypothetical protein M3Q33_14195 [Acidobacteriota bacterium]|nr:hypothetical protein [Acidobacteriota bacterium]